MSFESLGLRAELLSAIAALGYTTPTPIQSQAIPVIFEGCDLLAGARPAPERQRPSPCRSCRCWVKRIQRKNAESRVRWFWFRLASWRPKSANR